MDPSHCLLRTNYVNIATVTRQRRHRTLESGDNHLEGLGMGWTRPECSFLHEFVLRKLHRRLGLRSLGWGRDQPWSPACIGWC